MPDDPNSSGKRPRSSRARQAGLLRLGMLGDTVDDTGVANVGPFEEPGDLIGRYRLVSPLGSGGFGNVWLAEQTDPIQREVALKLIKAGMDSREIIARFEAERQALALMDHPNIAAVIDAGTSVSGRPFFVLELVRGMPITAYCDSHQLGIRERIELMIVVCSAVQHAHQKAILHRDLKPSNILVTEVDGRPVPKVIDFGIAKALAVDAVGMPDSSALHTQVGSVIGTPQYMSPEQAGSVRDVDTRSDIYSLGTILYELMVGRTPLSDAIAECAHGEELRVIREFEPLRPSARAQLRAGQPTSIPGLDGSRLSRCLRGDLDWVTMKALEKHRGLRYQTATALALDLQAYLSQKPVTAAAPTWSYRFGKFARRNRPALISAGLVATALVAGTIVSLWQAREAKRHQAEAERNLARAEEAVERFLSRFTSFDRIKGADFADFKIHLLKEAIPFYEEFCSREEVDPMMRHHRASTFSRLGRLYFLTDEADKAATAARKAVEIEESLVAEFPHDAEYRRGLCERANNLAVILHSKREHAEADAMRKRALEMAELAYAAQPRDRDAQGDLIHVLSNTAMALKDRGRRDEAEATYERAMKLQENLAIQFNKPDQWHLLVTLRGTTAEIAAGRGDLNKANTLYSETLKLLEKLVREAPGTSEFRNDFANVSQKWGTLACEMGNPNGGLPALKRAVESFQKLTGEFPSQPELRYSAAMARVSLGQALRKVLQWPEAAAQFQEAIVLQEKLASEYPEVAKFRTSPISTLGHLAHLRREINDQGEAKKILKLAIERQKKEFRRDPNPERARLADFYKELAEVSRKLSESEGAFVAAWDAAKMDPDRGERWSFAASMGANCLRKIESGVPAAGGRRAEITEHYATTIVNMLRQAAVKGYDGLAQFCVQERIPWLAERADFKALLEELSTRGPRLDNLTEALEKSPSKFTFNYPFPGDPGRRKWVRTDATWIETEPSGGKSTFKVFAPILVDGVPGTEVRNVNGQVTLFVPQRGAKPMHLMIQRAGGLWDVLGVIEDVE